MGVDSDDYSRLLLEDIPNIEAWMGIGTTAHGIPNRISYHLDFMGPSGTSTPVPTVFQGHFQLRSSIQKPGSLTPGSS